MTLPTEITHLIDKNEIEEAIVAITRLIENSHGNACLFFERGRLFWRLERRRDAISDYARSAELDPASPAAEALEQAMTIMQFYDKSRYNP